MEKLNLYSRSIDCGFKKFETLKMKNKVIY